LHIDKGDDCKYSGTCAIRHLSIPTSCTIRHISLCPWYSGLDRFHCTPTTKYLLQLP